MFFMKFLRSTVLRLTIDIPSASSRDHLPHEWYDLIWNPVHDYKQSNFKVVKFKYF